MATTTIGTRGILARVRTKHGQQSVTVASAFVALQEVVDELGKTCRIVHTRKDGVYHEVDIRPNQQWVDLRRLEGSEMFIPLVPQRVVDLDMTQQPHPRDAALHTLLRKFSLRVEGREPSGFSLSVV